MADAARLETGGESTPPPTPSPRGRGGASRRGVIAGAAASLCAGPTLAAETTRLVRFTFDAANGEPAAEDAEAIERALAAIEARVGGRIGVEAQGAGARFGYRADERFPMCSTFKAMAVAAALANVDSGDERLDRFVRYGKADLLEYAPVTTAHLKKGGMAFGDLCAAAIIFSDNTAANLILKSIGGPAGWTRFVRRIGDQESRLDRWELALNSAIPGDPRDTTTPAAMAADLRAVLLGGMLGQITTGLLKGWMAACQTGLTRLRAGTPKDWVVADKTGTGAHGTANDIAVIWAPHGPIVVACYLTETDAAKPAARDAAIADVGRLVASTFRPAPRRG